MSWYLQSPLAWQFGLLSLTVVCRLPSHLHEIWMKVKKAEKELADKLLREPTQEEIATQAGITEAKLHSLHKVRYL